MALKDTVSAMKRLLDHISHDLNKAVEGNKAASQRVRTHSIEFEKTAKAYRKESVASERKGENMSGSGKTKSPEIALKRVTAKLPTRRR
jgi:hypothetical protein